MKQLFSGLIKTTLVSAIAVALISCGGAEERKEKYLEKGKSYFEERNYEKANVELKNVLQIDPNYAEAYFLIGRIQDSKKEYGKAISNYTKAAELDKNSIAPRLKLARLYIVIGSTRYIDDAERYISEVLALDKDNLEAKLYSAIINYKNDPTPDNLSVIEKISMNDPSIIDGITMLAYTYMSQNNDAKAMQVLEKGVTASPEDISLKLMYAKLLTRNDHPKKAEEQLLEALSLDSENYSLTIALSAFYSTIGELEKAENVLRTAIRDDEEDVKRYLVLIKFLSSKISAKTAEDELNKLISEQPDVPDFKFYLVELYKGTGRIEQAKEILNDLLKESVINKAGVIARTMLAEILLEERSFTKASDLVAEVLKEYPNNSEALIVRSKISLYSGDTKAPVNDLRTVLKSQPQNEEASMLLAKAHIMNNEVALAEDVLSTAIANDSTNYKVYINLATYYLQKDQVEKAIDIVEKALIRLDDNIELLMFKSKILAKLGDEDGYLKTLNQMKKSHAEDFRVYNEFGKYYLAKRDYAKAKSSFESALELSNDDYKTLELMVRTFALSGNIDDAISFLNDKLTVKSDFEKAGLNHLMGQVYIAKKNYDESEKFFKKSIENRKDWVTPYMSLADLYTAQSKYSSAINVYKEGISNIQASDNFRIKLAAVYEKSGDLISAINEYDIVLNNNSQNAVARNNLASLLLEVENTGDNYTRALSLVKDFENSNQPAFRDTLAWVYYHLNDFSKAVDILKDVVEQTDGIAVFHYHYGMALLKSGDMDNAKKNLLIAVDSDQDFLGKIEAEAVLKEM